MTLAELNKKISGINANIQRVNNERQVNMGKYEALKAQLDTALVKYNDTYGVSLDSSNLESEVERVSKELEAQVVKMESALDKINQKDYAGAEAVLGVVHEAPKPDAEVKVSEPLATGAAANLPMPDAPAVEVPPRAVQEPPAQPEIPFEETPTPQMPPVFEKSANAEVSEPKPANKPFSQPKQGGLTGAAKFGAPPADDEDDMDIPAPPPAAPPTKPKRTMTFKGIMDGTSFNPGGM